MDVLTDALDNAAVLEYSRFVHLYCGSATIPSDSSIATDALIITDEHSQPGDVDAIGACGMNDLCNKFQ
ncbi:hypothetical protein EWW49_34115 [Pseudomonas syringae]|nr:hypothetical protein EWW49_34115 [Pseudomonas syringae]